MIMEVYLVYEGDDYLSHSSLVLMGIFKTKNDAISAILEHGNIETNDIEQAKNNLIEQNQTQCLYFGCRYFIKKTNIGKWDEM